MGIKKKVFWFVYFTHRIDFTATFIGVVLICISLYFIYFITSLFPCQTKTFFHLHSININTFCTRTKIPEGPMQKKEGQAVQPHHFWPRKKNIV